MKVYATNFSGVRYELNPGKYPATQITGIGASEATVSTEKLAKHGTKYNHATTNERNIVFSFALVGDVEKNRNELYKIFPPALPVHLEFVTGQGSFFIVGYTETNDPNLFGIQSRQTVSIICPEPFFCSEEKQLTGTGFQIESDFPFENDYFLLTEFTESASAFTLTNGTETMRITHDFVSGDVLQVDTKERTIKINGENRYNDKTGDWVLIQPGTNALIPSHDCTIMYTEKYIGI